MIFFEGPDVHVHIISFETSTPTMAKSLSSAETALDLPDNNFFVLT